MATFVLLHGACHGGWCFGPSIDELESLGHRAVAPDLPVDDPDAGWADYLQAATAIFGGDEVTLVAHSRAGRLLPLVLDNEAVVGLVLVSAPILGGRRPSPHSTSPIPAPDPGRRPSPPRRDELGRSVIDPEVARELLFHDCPEPIQNWAIERLRPQCDLPPPTETVWRDLPTTYIACTEDRVVDPIWMFAAALDRLGVQALPFASGHSPFLARPREFAELLDSLVER